MYLPEIYFVWIKEDQQSQNRWDANLTVLWNSKRTATVPLAGVRALCPRAELHLCLLLQNAEEQEVKLLKLLLKSIPAIRFQLISALVL